MVNRFLDTLMDRTVVPGFSRIGYSARRRGWTDLPTDALAGQVVAVTGANSGLGKATVTGAARLGAEVRMLCRDRTRGQRAREDVLAEVPGARLEVDVCDVSSFASVRAVGERLGKELGGLHGLVHNAGAMVAQRTETADGHELTLETHVLGPHLLTAALQPLLTATGDARVVFVSSGGMYTQKLHTEDLEYRQGEYSGTVAYARTKRMQVVLAEQWAKHLAGTGIHVHSMHPGWAATPGLSESLPGFGRLVGPVLRTAEQGADTTVWLLAAEEAGQTTGRFWHDRRTRPTSYLPLTISTPDQQRVLWEFCVDATGAPQDWASR